MLSTCACKEVRQARREPKMRSPLWWRHSKPDTNLWAKLSQLACKLTLRCSRRGSFSRHMAFWAFGREINPSNVLTSFCLFQKEDLLEFSSMFCLLVAPAVLGGRCKWKPRFYGGQMVGLHCKLCKRFCQFRRTWWCLDMVVNGVPRWCDQRCIICRASA